MKRYLSHLRNGALAVAVLGCLAFGASQALAIGDNGTPTHRATCPSSNCRAECGFYGGQRLRPGAPCLCCAEP